MELTGRLRLNTLHRIEGDRMMRALSFVLGLAAAAAAAAGWQQTPPPAAQQATTPPADNDRTMRQLSPEEIPPNLNFYAIDPLYAPGVALGWSPVEIRERFDRGLVAVAAGGGGVHLSWRLLQSDPPNVAFDVYRSAAGARGTRLNATPLRSTTDFTDPAPAAGGVTWRVVARADGKAPAGPDATWSDPPIEGHRALKLRDDVRSVDRVGIGDLDGDGNFDFVVKHPSGNIDPGRRVPSRDTYKIDGYSGRTGAFMWRIDLGWNVNHGIWFSPMVVRDLDGDGRAEVCLKTAPYAATREQMFSPDQPFVLDGPEYLSVYSGETGKEIDRVDWIERGRPEDWADHSGNRASRHMMGVAYLDGRTPSVLVVRGTYGLMKVDAWTLQEGRLQKVWRWTNERAPFKYQGQGQHSIKAADIDGDGADEILNGSIAIDSDGRTLWSTGLGHGDRFYVTDIDPARPGLEVWYTIEDPHPQNGVSLWDALRGRLIFGSDQPNNDNEIAGGLVGDIDPAHPGMEVWANKYFFTAQAGGSTGPSLLRTSSSGGTATCCARSTRAAQSRNGRGRSSGGRPGRFSTSPTSSATGGKRS
jgi:hypothetical protein